MNENMLRHAIHVARDKMRGLEGGPFGAVIARDGEIISTGWNRVTSKNDPTAHAEIVAIREACARMGTFSLAGFEIYSSCEPCPMCLSAVYWARLDRLIYAATREDAAKIGFDDDVIHQQVCLPADLRSLPMTRALREEAVEVMEAWSRLEGRVEY